MVKSDLLISQSHPHVAQITRNWIYSDLAMSPINLANAAFKFGKRENVQEQMERARSCLEIRPGYAFRDDAITRAWKAGILIYETRAKFYCSQGIEIEPLQIYEIEIIKQHHPFRPKKLEIEQLLREIEGNNLHYRTDIGLRWYRDSDLLQTWSYLK